MATIGDDANLILTDINNAIDVAMMAVAYDMRDCLLEHIYDEVYTYESRVYPRSYTLAKAALNSVVSGGGNEAKIEFNPSGVNTKTWASMDEADREEYGKDPSDPVKPNPVFGDAFIGRIEEGVYDFKGVHVGARPFFTNTVKELIEGRRALTTFISSFNSAATLVQAVDKGDQEIFRTGDDWTESTPF